MPRLVTNGRSGSTILVVDDQESALEATSVLLTREGNRVLAAASGGEALELLAHHDVQLILVDYCMPAMSGTELIKAIRARDPYVQIVLQTGFAGPKPPRALLAELDIQGYHNKADGPDALLMWVDVGLKAHKLIQHLLERERQQAQLVANVSHEFRTPLNIIAGYSDMLLDGSFGSLSEAGRGTVQSIAQTNRALSELVTNFLQYARVDAGVVAPSEDCNRTRELVKELAAFGGVLVKVPDVEFASRIGPMPETFLTDSVKLRTILRNLIGNAAKFTDRGSVTLRMSSTSDTLVFEIHDTGPGIAADKLEAVFEPFRQLDGSSTRSHGGVGLGLALSHRLARILGGRLTLESTVGVGSTFVLTIPRREAGAPPDVVVPTARARARTVARAAVALAPFAATVASIWLYAVACPPYEWSAAAWIAPGLLLVATRGLGWGRAVACGFLFGALFGLWITGWTFHATLAYFGADRVRAGGFVLGMWLVYAGIPYALAILAYGVAAPRVAPALQAVVGAWIWVASEWLRSTMLTGLPWELLGDTQYRNLGVIQIADLGGVYLVSFVIALASIAGAETVASLVRREAWSAALPSRLALPAAALAATLLYGRWAVAAYATAPEEGARTVTVVQARIPTAFRWKRAFFHRTIAAYAGLTRTSDDAAPDLIVWPENAANFYLAGEPLLTAQLGTVAARARAGLVVGGPRLDDDGRARNAAYLVGGDGTVRAAYDKQRLVPFAEYDPFRRLRPAGDGDPDTYVAGSASTPLAADGMTLGAMICYEALFPHLVRGLVRAGADVLVNISNDAWLDRGDGAAPKQHFSHVVFRAIENRRYMVRASDSGMSGFVAPSGRIYSVVPEGEEGAATGRVVPLAGTTPYGRCGDAWIALGGAALALGALRRDRVRHGGDRTVA